MERMNLRICACMVSIVCLFCCCVVVWSMFSTLCILYYIYLLWIFLVLYCCRTHFHWFILSSGYLCVCVCVECSQFNRPTSETATRRQKSQSHRAQDRPVPVQPTAGHPSSTSTSSCSLHCPTPACCPQPPPLRP